MNTYIRNLVMVTAVIGIGLCGAARPGFSAAGAPPHEPIDAASTGADLKFACGQENDEFEEVVGELMYRLMLIVQCRAVIGAVTEMITAGHYAGVDAAKWQCVDTSADLGELSAAFVTWVGRRPTLMRQPAAIAFIGAIEMSTPCK